MLGLKLNHASERAPWKNVLENLSHFPASIVNADGPALLAITMTS